MVSTVWEGYSVVPLLSKDHSRTHSLNWCTPHVHHRRHYCSHHQQVIIHVSECCSGPRRYCCDLEGQTVDPDRELSPTAAAIQSAVSFSTLIFLSHLIVWIGRWYTSLPYSPSLFCFPLPPSHRPPYSILQLNGIQVVSRFRVLQIMLMIR